MFARSAKSSQQWHEDLGQTLKQPQQVGHFVSRQAAILNLQPDGCYVEFVMRLTVLCIVQTVISFCYTSPPDEVYKVSR